MEAEGAKRKRGRPVRTASADATAQILGAALRVFARAGFVGASLSDVATEARVARPLIHYHFVSKEALWRATVDAAFATQQAELAYFSAQLGALRGTDALQLAARQLAHFASRYPDLVRIVVDETSKGGPRADFLREQYLLPGYRLAAAILAGYRAASGVSRPGPGPELVIPMLLGAMNFPALEADVVQAAFGTDVRDPGYVERHAQALARLLEALA